MESIKDLKVATTWEIMEKEDLVTENQRKYFELEEIGVTEDGESYHQHMTANNTIPEVHSRYWYAVAACRRLQRQAA